MNADGSNLTRLTDGAGEVFPRITPDGRWIIYQRGIGQTTSTLWRMPLEGGAAEQITKTHSTFPTLAPDGTHVASFYMGKSQSAEVQWRIGVVRVADGAPAFSFPLSENIIGRVARWTPDSASIVYAEANGEIGNLWRQPLDDSPPVQMTHFDAGIISDFAWSLDGKRLAFTRGTQTSDAILIQNFR